MSAATQSTSRSFAGRSLTLSWENKFSCLLGDFDATSASHIPTCGGTLRGMMNESRLINANALQELRIDDSEVDAFLSNRAQNPPEKMVCICGHATNKHNEISKDYWSCVTARHYCPCAKPIPVLLVQDTRYFMRKTYGYGAKHAMSTGLRKLNQEGKWSKFIIDLSCFRCNSTDVKLHPAALNRDFRISDRPEAINVLLCWNCLQEQF